MPFVSVKFMLWCAVAALWVLPVDAQQRVEDGVEITTGGQAYLKALRFRGIDTDVAYYDPSRPPPDLETRETPDPDGLDVDVNLGSDQDRLILNALSLAVLLGLAYLLVRFGGRFSVSLRADQDTERQMTAAQGGVGAGAMVPENLEAIAGIEDRKLALVTLAQSTLIRAVRDNDLLLQRSWTARDALRRLPKDMMHRDALCDLVTAGERVLFGGRDVTEADFQGHVTHIRPLFSDRST